MPKTRSKSSQNSKKNNSAPAKLTHKKKTAPKTNKKQPAKPITSIHGFMLDVVSDESIVLKKSGISSDKLVD